LRERYEEYEPGDLPPDERTWRDFVRKHVPLAIARVDELMGAMVFRGGLMHCAKCGVEAKCICGCGSPYLVTHHWAIRGTGALDRALAAVADTPQKSNRALAIEVGVDHKTVAKARRALKKRARRKAADPSPLDSPPAERATR
jgi:hypothetical protein